LSGLLGKYLSSHSIEALQMLLISFVVWNAIKIIVMNLKLKDTHLPRAEWLDLRNRIVSVIHGVIVLFLSGYNTYFAHS
jgi:hypothetical protein